MKYYAVADVHGFTTCLRQALEQAGFYEDTEPHKLIMCGDLLDRGTEANQLIEFMIELNQRGELIYILGNHEDLLTKAVHQVVRGGIYEVASPMSHHCLNGTWDTLLQIS